MEAKRAALRDADERRSVGANRRSQATRAALNAAGRAAERLADRDRFAERAAGVATQTEGLAERRREQSARLKQAETRQAALEAAARKAEDGLRDRSARLAAVADRLREEYGVNLAEIAVLPPDRNGASALQELAEERSVGSAGRTDGEDAASSQTVRRADPTELPSLENERSELNRRVDSLRGKLRAMGAVDPDSLATLEELQQRHTKLARELGDLVEAKRLLEDLIRRVNRESKELFLQTFAAIRGHFQTLFRQLFGGGEGDVRLADENDPLECGVDVFARPPGKEPRNISLLSGGEKTIVCVGLLLAIFRSNPSPFCILDEVDAALDEANIGRFLHVMAEFKKQTQFLMVTHR
ncbi:MAG: AAA family ATPase, partial [Planctomycetota bacterium]